jgi:hypothetical protein
VREVVGCKPCADRQAEARLTSSNISIARSWWDEHSSWDYRGRQTRPPRTGAQCPRTPSQTPRGSCRPARRVPSFSAAAQILRRIALVFTHAEEGILLIYRFVVCECGGGPGTRCNRIGDPKDEECGILYRGPTLWRIGTKHGCLLMGLLPTRPWNLISDFVIHGQHNILRLPPSKSQHHPTLT